MECHRKLGGDRAPQTAVNEIRRRQVFFQTIADKFTMLRGAGFDLSATDRALIECWFDRGVPLWLVCSVLDEIENRPRRRARIRHLGYLEDEIEARFAEWREMRVGE